MIGRYAGFGAYGAPDAAKAEAKVVKYADKVAAGQRCGFPPSKANCAKLMTKWQAKLDAANMQLAAMQNVTAQTSPEAAAAAVDQAVADQIAAAQAAADSTPYIAGGVVLLGVLGAFAAVMFGGK
jgi:hypothetical protein